ncbi:MAG: DUF4270 family protein [Alistipes sp.]
MNRRGRLRAGAAALLFLSALASCTEVDNRLGESLIPDDQQMKIKVDTVYGIDTYLAKTDSFPSERLSYMYLGSAVDPVFGRTAASASSQYVLSYYSSSYDDGDIFGTAPVFDSLVLLFTLDASYLGDTTKTQKFNVYELVNDLDDSVYYSNFDQSTVLGDQPLFDFELTGVPTSQRRVRLEGPAVEEFARKLMDTTGGPIPPTRFSMTGSRDSASCPIVFSGRRLRLPDRLLVDGNDAFPSQLYRRVGDDPAGHRQRLLLVRDRFDDRQQQQRQYDPARLSGDLEGAYQRYAVRISSRAVRIRAVLGRGFDLRALHGPVRRRAVGQGGGTL